MTGFRWIRRVVLLALTFSLCACAGRLTWDTVDALRSNPSTTENDVVRALGQPDVQQMKADGLKIYTYRVIAAYGAGEKYCHFAFHNGKLVNYSEMASGIYRR